MAAAYLEADLGALYRLAELVERDHRGDLPVSGLAEIRQIEDRFGMSPRARQLLLWQVLAGGERAESSPPPSSSSGPATNVRRLRAVDPAASG